MGTLSHGIMKRVIKVLVLIMVLFISRSVFANTPVHLKIQIDTGIIYDSDMEVEPCDSEGDGVMKETAYCALVKSGIPSEWSGLWTNSINGIVNNDNNNGAYWMWLANLNTNNPYSDFACHQDAPYSCSAKQYILNPNDNILFYYNINPLSPPAPDPVPISNGGGGSGGGRIMFKPIVPKVTFDIDKAYKFLADQQKINGTWGEEIYTDWSTLALMGTDKYQNTKIKLTKYYSSNKIKGTLLTDYERRAIATMSLGINPYNINGENYIEKITNTFDGKQFGDPNEENDDIFALVVLQNAGYETGNKMISGDIVFILNNQKIDGSWNDSIDLTGAAIEALAFSKENLLVKSALEKAAIYLKQNQKTDGGFGNISTTAWAMQGILALGEKPIDWVKTNSTGDGTSTPLDYLAINQDIDGGIKETDLNSKIWETAYVLSSVAGNPWNQTIQKFKQPEPEVKPVAVEKQNILKPKITKTKNLESISATPPAPEIIIPTNTVPVKKENGFKRFINKIMGIFF